MDQDPGEVSATGIRLARHLEVLERGLEDRWVNWQCEAMQGCVEECRVLGGPGHQWGEGQVEAFKTHLFTYFNNFYD